MEQSEKELQNEFIENLKDIGYNYVEINDECDLKSNLKDQLEKFNKKPINDFNNLLDYLFSGDLNSKFDKLRKGYNNIQFIDFSDFSSNFFQVLQEITVSGNYNNRYDVTILINGFPLVQIELKKSGVSLKNAFNQINRYHSHSYTDLFNYIQLFVISNKVHTRYFFNDSNFDYDFSYIWKDNKYLSDFTNSFLIPENLIYFISNYIFKDNFSNSYKMLRPYQIDAIDDVYLKIKEEKNSYLWMSFNSGKSLTSFRLAEILKNDFKVIYLATDYLSNYPSNLIANYSYEISNMLNNQNLVVTNVKNIINCDNLYDNKLIFIFNEYEKQFRNHNPLKLMENFKNSLFYCFTSAPIFNENLVEGKTTKYIFNNHDYSFSFKDALNDNICSDFNIKCFNEECGEFISTKERINKISNYIINSFNSKSILFVSSNEDLINYFFCLKDSTLKIAIFLHFENNELFNKKPIRDYFDEIINFYNDSYGSNISLSNNVDVLDIINIYEKDLIEKFNDNQIDLLIINKHILFNEYEDFMLFEDYKFNRLVNLKDSSLNTVYLDCILKYGSLLEVISMNKNKSDSTNIISFRNLENNIKQAIKLFSNNKSVEDYCLKDYDYYLNKFKDQIIEIKDSNNFYDSFKKLNEFYHILVFLDNDNLSQNERDDFNEYKDQYEHLIEKDKVIKSDFNINDSFDFKINLEYVNNLINYSDKSAIYNQTENFNENDNSEEIFKDNINKDFSSKTADVDNSKEVNIKKVNDDLDINQKEELSNTNKNKKICPVCEKEYDENENFCLYCEGPIELCYPEKLVKVCPFCGKKYIKEESFCLYCEGPIELCYPEELVKFCPICGRKYTEEDSFCLYCNLVKLIHINK